MRAVVFVLLLTSLATQAQSDMEKGIQLCSSMGDGAQRLECYDAMARRAPEPASPAPNSAEKFGLPPAQAEKSNEIGSIRSRLLGEFRGWQPGALFTLQNGQIWKCTGDDRAFYPDVPANPEIVISKSYLGAYWMEIAIIGRKVKVTRVK